MKIPIVLIAYSQEDFDVAKRLENAIVDLGIALHPNQTEVHKRDQSGGVVGQAVALSDLLLVLWSGSAEASSMFQLEWTTALALNKPIIVCRVDETPVPVALGSSHSILLHDFNERIAQIRIAPRRLKLGESGQQTSIREPGTPAPII